MRKERQGSQQLCRLHFISKRSYAPGGEGYLHAGPCFPEDLVLRGGAERREAGRTDRDWQSNKPRETQLFPRRSLARHVGSDGYMNCTRVNWSGEVEEKKGNRPIKSIA